MSNIVDLKLYKLKKYLAENPADTSSTLFVNHSTGKASDMPTPTAVPVDENRLDNIRKSLEKINKLMADLKKMGENNVNDRSHDR